MIFSLKIAKTTYDIMRDLNATVWGGSESAEKVRIIVKTGMSIKSVLIGTSYALEDFTYPDIVCGSLDSVKNVSSAFSMVISNITTMKHLVLVTGLVTFSWRLVRYYCKQYGTL